MRAEARLSEVPVFYGDILSEEAHHSIDPKRFSTLIAVTDNDAYNSLVCTDFAPELGRSHVYQLGRGADQSKRMSLNFTLGGRPLTEEGVDFRTLRERHWQGWTFQATKLTEEFDYDAYLNSRAEEAIVLLWVKPSGKLVFAAGATGTPSTDDRIISFTPAKERRAGGNGDAAAEEKE